MKEIWKNIPGFSKKYEVSTLGNVRTIEHYDSSGNLVWGSSSENQQDMKKHGTFRGVAVIRSDGKIYSSIREVRQDGFSDGLVAGVCEGKQDAHKEYGWEYA